MSASQSTKRPRRLNLALVPPGRAVKLTARIVWARWVAFEAAVAARGARKVPRSGLFGAALQSYMGF